MTTALIDGMPEAEYHAHPALSSSGARKLLPPSCPAKYAYERQQPSPPTKEMKVGTAAHREVLGIGSDVVVSDEWDTYRTKAAQEWRDAAEAAGKVPMLAHEYQPIREMRAALVAHPLFGALFDPARGKAEQSLFWTDETTGVPCRARFDFLPNPVEGRRLVIADYKKGRSAEPAEFARQSATLNYALQADWYRRGAVALGLDRDPAFVFAVQEPEPPYLLTVAQIHERDLRRAHAMNDHALRIFARCTETGHWPGYADDVVTVEMPIWWQIAADDMTERNTEL